MTTEAEKALQEIINSLSISDFQKTVLYNAIEMIVIEEIRKSKS